MFKTKKRICSISISFIEKTFHHTFISMPKKCSLHLSPHKSIRKKPLNQKMADNSINLNDSSSPVLAAGGIISNLPSSSSQRQTRKSKTMTSPNSNNNNSNSNAATTPANHQSEQLALHLIKRELLRVQTAIDKETIHNNPGG